jgi:hypothetical protein
MKESQNTHYRNKLMGQFLLTVGTEIAVKVVTYAVCLKSKCTDFPMDELEM